MVNTRLGLDGLRETLEECDARAVIVEPSCNEFALPASSGVEHRICLDGPAPGWLDYEDWIAAAPDHFEPPKISSLSMGEVCFTSGSTGRPKGVMISHRATIMKMAHYANYHRSIRDEPVRSIVHLPIFHANARLSIGAAFETGGTIVIQKKFDPRATLMNIAKYRINYILSVAPVYLAMLKEEDLLAELDFSSLKYPLIGSAGSGADLLRRVEKAMGVKMVHTYGSTEGGTVLQHRPGEQSPLESCGRVLPGNEVKIVDPLTGEAGNVGELWIRSESIGLGYLNRPEDTAEKFVNGWYRSGDLFERDEQGDFYFRGRVDDMFNVGGEKVYPAEVEFILQSHPMVAAASVVALDHGEKGQVPAAMVMVNDGGVTETELKEYCLQKGPAYAHPRRIVFVDAFPLTASGKVDRIQVRAALKQSN